MTKKREEYQFVCWECNGIYTTYDKGMPLCRGCQSRHASKLPNDTPKQVRDNIIHLYGEPSPTPLQAAKWRSSRSAKRLIKERQRKIEGED